MSPIVQHPLASTQFIVIWANFDPDATCHIPTSKLPFLLEAIGPPLGIHSHDSRIDVLNRTKYATYTPPPLRSNTPRSL